MIPRLLCWSRNSTRRSLSSSSSSTVATTTTSSINSSSSVSLVYFWWRRLAAIAMLSSTTSYPYSSILMGGYSWGLTATSSSARSVHRPHVSLFAAAASTTTSDSDDHNTMNQDSSSQDPTTCSNSGDENDIQTEPTPSPRIFQHADDSITVHHFGRDSPIASTQDEARRILQQQQQSGSSSTNNNNLRYLAVLADRQTNGRGTSGRSWEYGAGNLYLTLCIPFHEIPVMPTLLPLQIAVTIAQQVQKTLSPSSLAAQEDVVHVKWPNDVLLRDQKLAGTLIESELVMNTNVNDDGSTTAAAGSTTWLLIGIGVNIEHAPSLQGTTGKHVRSPVCLRDYWNLDKEGSQPVTALDLGLRISESLVKWISTSSSASASSSSRATREAQVVQEWKALFPFGSVYEMRASDPQQEMNDDFVGEKVVAVDLRYDGQLVVQGADGKERLLVADYLF